jgi:protein TonB
MATVSLAEPPALHAPPPEASTPTGPSRKSAQPHSEHRAADDPGFLTDVLLENHHLDISTRSKVLDLCVVILLHVALIGGPILAGLYFTDTLNLKAYYATLLVAPPPPPPPPPAPAMAQVRAVPHRVFIQQGRLVAPTYIPKQVAQIKEAAAEPELDGVIGGVPGGVPGGQMGGVLGGIISGAKSNVAPPPPGPVSKAPVRVGGKVKSPRPLFTPSPLYPFIAKQTHVEGAVQIDAILDTDGSVIEMKVVSGHPLLIQAAMDAVRSWKYEPSYLNGQPIAVELIVTVTFVLQH